MKSLKRRAKKFRLHNYVGEGNEWPNNQEVLLIEVNRENKYETKLYIPFWQKEAIISHFHHSEGEAGHFGYKKLYNSVCSLDSPQ